MGTSTLKHRYTLAGWRKVSNKKDYRLWTCAVKVWTFDISIRFHITNK